MPHSVLIADDSAVLRRVLKRSLKMSGLEIRPILMAADGKEALDLLAENQVDVLFTGINMPVMNGIRLLEELGKRNLLQSTSVVVVSAEGSESRKESLRQAGVRGYLRKPFTAEQAAEMLMRIVAEPDLV